jgi:hypothetical protein
MGKARYKGPVPPDDPMFSGGVKFFRKIDTEPELAPLSKTNFVRRVKVNWSGNELKLDLSEETWALIQDGKPVTLEELDENDELTYRWLFNDEPDHSLIVDFGDPNHLRWLGQLEDAVITEIKG